LKEIPPNKALLTRNQNMKTVSTKTAALAVAGVLAIAAIVTASQGPATKSSDPAEVEKAVLARLADIQNAAQALDANKVFSFVLENDKGALVQNGRLLLTRKDALESTRRGFQGLQKVSYQFDQQHVTLLCPTVALVVGEGSSTATTDDGRTLNRRFAQSVVLVLTNGDWKVFHSHRSFPPNQ
jgi:ketosteroid isomerase-like protein